MQLMFEKSFEMGKNQGLGFIKGSVKELQKKKFFFFKHWLEKSRS